MPKRSDVRTLKNLIDQAYLIASSNPLPKGGIESIQENLDAARALVRVLLIRPSADQAAAMLGKRGGAKTAERGAQYYSEISGQRKTFSGGRPKKYSDVLSTGAKPSSVRSRAAFIIARRAQELGLDSAAVAQAIHASEQYVRNLVQGITIPSDEKVNALIAGLKLDEVSATNLRQTVAADRVRNDGRFNKI